MPEFLLPKIDQRVTVVGRTGSGKTQFGAWLLSESRFDLIPYVIIDYKRDRLLNSSERIRRIGVNETPKHPGVYIVHPLPHEEAGVEGFLWRCWKRENTGIYFDEMYSLPEDGKSKALRAVLTQGRSKNVPAICVSQRPAWLSRFVFTETDHIACFHLNDVEDRRRVQSFMPPEADIIETIPPRFSCVWYRVTDHALFRLQPVPEADNILDRLDDRLAPRRKAI